VVLVDILDMILVVIIFCWLVLVSSQPPGWRMVDRFYGFRYEISGPNLVSLGFDLAAQKEADILGCFGWIQRSRNGNLVGEARCNKTNGPKFEEWLKSGGPDFEVLGNKVLVYEDTKIRLHFSHFKILDDTRDTCFLEPPHQCEDLSVGSPQKQSYKPDEL